MRETQNGPLGLGRVGRSRVRRPRGAGVPCVPRPTCLAASRSRRAPGRAARRGAGGASAAPGRPVRQKTVRTV